MTQALQSKTSTGDPRIARTIRSLQIGNDWFGERQGGLNRVYDELLRHLPDAGVQARGLVVGSEAVERETAGVITAFASPHVSVTKRMMAGRRAALRMLTEQKPDLIAAHFALYAFPILDKLARLPFVMHFHGPWAAESGVEGQLSWASRAQLAMERSVYARARRLIVLSHAFESELVHRYGIAPEKIRLVPGGIDTERFNDSMTRTDARLHLGWPTDRPIALAVRRHVRRMGLENLIDAVQRIVVREPNLLLLIGGSGPITEELRTRIKEKALERNIRLLGRIDDGDLPIAYRAADVSVVPSQALEGFGMITLESLASGTPVLVTPVGGLPEVVQPFAPECIFAGTATEPIADLLGEFLAGKRLLPSSTACRNYAVTNFAWPVIARQTRAVYEEALA
jgi:glycosyltransferase involved in cell wall biosynthesis